MLLRVGVMACTSGWERGSAGIVGAVSVASEVSLVRLGAGVAVGDIPVWVARFSRTA